MAIGPIREVEIGSVLNGLEFAVESREPRLAVVLNSLGLNAPLKNERFGKIVACIQNLIVKNFPKSRAVESESHAFVVGGAGETFERDRPLLKLETTGVKTAC